MIKRAGNIGKEQHKIGAEYFAKYWDFFIERNPNMDTEKWMNIFFMTFLSGFSAGIILGEKQKKTLIEEIVQSN